jgi:hypothetical protein
MSEPPESQFEPLARKAFAFFPPILNIEHNQWEFRRAAWSEILVVNTKTGAELWIPRRYLGEISSVDEPVTIVGLTKELEFKAGAVWPHSRRVVEIPHAVNDYTPAAVPAPAAPRVAGIRHEASTESRIGRLIAAVVVVSLLACFAIIAVMRNGLVRNVTFTAADQDFLSLTRRDDIHTIARKLGEPAETRWQSEAGELQYCALWYPQRAYYVILMGPERNSARYVGTLDGNWRVVHYVELARGGNTASLLRGLRKF